MFTLTLIPGSTNSHKGKQKLIRGSRAFRIDCTRCATYFSFSRLARWFCLARMHQRAAVVVDVAVVPRRLQEPESADAEDLQAGAMRNAAQGLGVMCDTCHVADRSSDEKPEKLTARMMFAMVKDINAKFPDGKVHVTCYTCHRGAVMPLTAPPAAQ